MEHIQFTYPLELPTAYQVITDLREIKSSNLLYFCIADRADYVVEVKSTITGRKRIYYIADLELLSYD